MYIIDKQENKIIDVEEVTFSSLKFTERKHLQEWIRKKPDSLGEELLIIQKEFADFEGTNERLDLLAIDKLGNLVLIENKLDDSGKDVVWQALKYTAYCSTLSSSNIIDIFQSYLDSDESTSAQSAKDNILDFLNGDSIDSLELNSDQRVILVAAKFRKEVTSTVLWLINKGIDVKCIRVTPHMVNDLLLMTSEQIIPISEAEDYIIKMAKREQEKVSIKKNASDLEDIRFQYWSQLLPQMAEFNNISPGKGHWLTKGSGKSGISYVINFLGKVLRIELYIDTPDTNLNKEVYNLLLSNKDQLENDLGYELLWEELPHRRASRISHQIDIDDQRDKALWGEYNQFYISNEVKFIHAFDKTMKSIKLI